MEEGSGPLGLADEIIWVYTTHSCRKEALKLAEILVLERLVACVNVGVEMTSLYQWGGKIEKEQEVPIVMKAVKKSFLSLEKRILELHPYECPCLVALPVVEGHRPFLDWVIAQGQL